MPIPHRVHMAHLPTAVEPLPRISKMFMGTELWIKRDDQTGLAFGGNKTRKLEFFIADAQQSKAGCIITRGALQSNHCRQTAAAAARFGLRCILILSGHQPREVQGNLLLDLLFGAQIVWAGNDNPEQTLQRVIDKKKSEGSNPYSIPMGGSNALGAYAYALAMEEFLGQNTPVDRIILATSSGGTQAGMILGAMLFGFEGIITGISVNEKAPALRRRVSALVREAAALMDKDINLQEDDIVIRDEFIGKGYAKVSELEIHAIRLFAAQEGILLDPVYTGRAAGGMLALIRSGAIGKDENILFWHTGGAPALFAYGDVILSDE